MGAIMCIGVATANSILVVTFANDERMTGKDALAAALERRLHAHPAGDHDRAGHDHRHAARWPWEWAKAASRTPRSAAP